MSSSCHEMAFFTTNNNFILHHSPDHQSSPLNPMLPSCAHQDFPGVAAFLGKRAMSFEVAAAAGHEEMDGEDEVLSDDGSQAGEKKRRLNMEQVKTLEKNFELGNKLEPERKMQLARALGLQPRQIAIWFQNRRARWKTKQLEKDYDLLKRQFEAIKADNDNLHAQNRKLQAEIMALKSREAVELINLNKESREGSRSSSSNRSEDSSEVMKNTINQGSVESNTPTSIADLFPPAAGSCTSMRQQQASGITTQLFHNSSSPNSNNSNNTNIDINDNNIDNNNNTPITHNNQMAVKEENLISNMFCGIEDQSGFWPWLEHQHFN